MISGSLFDEALDLMKSVINGTQTERKVQYYSGHDSSIVALQRVIGISRTSMMGMIKPASALIVELHQNSTSGLFTVQVRRTVIANTPPSAHYLRVSPEKLVVRGMRGSRSGKS